MEIDGNGWNEGNSSMKQKTFCVQLKNRLCKLMPQKGSIDKTSDTPLCRLCNEKTESITHIVSTCSILAKSQYRKCHDKVGTYVHWLVCKRYYLQCSDKWYTHKPQSVRENNE